MTRSINPAVNTTATGVLKKLLCASVLGAFGLMAGAAQAVTITFDGVQNVVTPQLNAGDTSYYPGDAFTSNGFTFQANNGPGVDASEYGVVGAIFNSANPTNCTILECPSGASGLYYAGLNDGALRVTNTFVTPNVAGFRVAGLRYSFVSPVTGLANGSYGQLMLTGTTQTGATVSTNFNFAGQDDTGRFSFASAGAAFGGTILTSLSINACLYDETGACSTERFVTQNQAQFALDDLNLNEVPEPASVALVLLGLAGLGSVSRRRRN